MCVVAENYEQIFNTHMHMYTHAQNDYCNPLAHELRGVKIEEKGL